ncbi:hypothetical protein PIB30_065178, partial [Stylosanthes scabra]|nr:hypothetical protein [Stylosanthes scabra]
MEKASEAKALLELAQEEPLGYLVDITEVRAYRGSRDCGILNCLESKCSDAFCTLDSSTKIDARRGPKATSQILDSQLPARAKRAPATVAVFYANTGKGTTERDKRGGVFSDMGYLLVSDGPANQGSPTVPYPYEIIGGDSIERIRWQLLASKAQPSSLPGTSAPARVSSVNVLLLGSSLIQKVPFQLALSFSLWTAEVLIFDFLGTRYGNAGYRGTTLPMMRRIENGASMWSLGSVEQSYPISVGFVKDLGSLVSLLEGVGTWTFGDVSKLTAKPPFYSPHQVTHILRHFVLIIAQAHKEALPKVTGLPIYRVISLVKVLLRTGITSLVSALPVSTSGVLG